MAFIQSGVSNFKTEVRFLLVLISDKRVPWAARMIAIAAISYMVMPFDLIPDHIPVIGYADDVAIVWLGFRFARALTPSYLIICPLFLPVETTQFRDAFCRACHGSSLLSIGKKNDFIFLRCVECNTVVCHPYPSDTELESYYQNYVMTADYLQKEESKMRRSLRRIRRILRAGPPGSRFIDIGCSIGCAVAAANSLGLMAHGIDIDSAAIEIAKDNFHNGETFEVASVKNVAARGEVFDMVYASEVIEHLNDPEGFVAAIANIMTPGALLYLTAPDGTHFAVPEDFTRWDMACPPQHLTYFSRQGIAILLSRYGLRVTKFYTAFKPGIKLLAVKD